MASCDLPSSSSASSLPITSNPEDGPSVPSATVTKKTKNVMTTPLNLKLLCLLKNLVTERLKGSSERGNK